MSNNDGKRMVTVGHYAVIFIQLDDYLPTYDKREVDEFELPGDRWRAELHEATELSSAWQFRSRPLAMAWVYVYRFPEGGRPGEVRWIEVAEAERRKGYATLLWQGMGMRWPRILRTNPATDEGAYFLESLRRASATRGR